MRILYLSHYRRLLHTSIIVAQRICALRKLFLASLTVFLVSYLSISAVHANADDFWSQQRTDFKNARKALHKGQRSKYQSYLPQLEAYPLYQYLIYDKLILRISKSNNEEIRSFINTFDDGPLATRLRLNWLNQLQKRSDWESFLEFYQDDESLQYRCYFLRAKIKQEDIEPYLDDVREIWLSGKSQPKQCDPLFKWFEAEGYLTRELIWERMALAMQAKQISLAKYLAKKLPAEDQAHAKLWFATHSNPQKNLLSGAVAEDVRINRQIVRHGVSRLARRDLTAAHDTWLAIQENYAFGSDLHDAIERDLALRAAYRHDERATTWMYQLPKDVVDASTGMWRARSAIRTQDWELVLRGIAMLEDEEKSEPQWQYWKARAMTEKGLSSDAIQIYRAIAKDRSYYGFLAADKLDLPYNINHKPVYFSQQEIEEVESIPAILRARELLFVNQLSAARREWNYASKHFSQKQFQIAAYLAHQWQWHDYAIRTIAKANYYDDLDIRFPMPFDGIVQKYSSRKKLEPAFVYGIIRRESAFNPQARSPVGARGLMQLMPATAKEVSRQLNLKVPSKYDLYSPSYNVNLGSTYISSMLKRFDGHRALASAAYNAGPHRVRAWLPEDNELPADIWVDTIPFTETREYVRAILAYTALFEWKLSQTPTRISEHLSPVSPKPTG